MKIKKNKYKVQIVSGDDDKVNEMNEITPLTEYSRQLEFEAPLSDAESVFFILSNIRYISPVATPILSYVRPSWIGNLTTLNTKLADFES
jgi:hypothetical protein